MDSWEKSASSEDNRQAKVYVIFENSKTANVTATKGYFSQYFWVFIKPYSADYVQNSNFSKIIKERYSQRKTKVNKNFKRPISK